MTLDTYMDKPTFNKNYIILKYYDLDKKSYIESELFDVEDLISSVVDLTCEFTGYGITEWEFKHRSFEDNILSELYKFMLDDGSYYQLRTYLKIDLS